MNTLDTFSDIFSRSVITVVLIFFCFTAAFQPAARAQTPDCADSLRNVIQTTKNDTIRMGAMMAMGDCLYSEHPDSARRFYAAARDLSVLVMKNSKDPVVAITAKKHLAYAYYNLAYVNDDLGEVDSAFMNYQKSLSVYKELAAHRNKSASVFGKQGEASVFNDLGYMYKYKGDYQRAMAYYKASMKMNRELANYKQVATLLNNMGSLYRSMGNTQRAIEYISKSLDIARIIKDNEEIAYASNGIASIYDAQGNISEAIEYYQLSLKAYDAMGSKIGQAYVLLNMASMYLGQEDYSKALEFYTKANDSFEKAGDKKSLSISCNNIGAVYEKTGQLDLALEQYQKSLRLCEETSYQQGLSTALGNIGLLLDKKGDKKQAMEYFQKSAELSRSIGESQGLITAMVNMGTLQLETGNTAKALQLGNEAYGMSRDMGFPFLIKSAAGLLKQIYKKQGNFKEAMFFYELEIKMRDSIANEETYKQTMKQQARYEYEKKAATDSLEHVKAIEIKNLQIAKVEEEKQKQRIILYSFILGFIIILIFSIALFRLFVQKKRANKILAEQKLFIEQQNKSLQQANEEISAQRDEIAAQRDLVTEQKEHIEEQKKEITDSITYARRIQKAVLPELASVFGNVTQQEATPFCCDYFVLYMPKDIVSGDFYWATRIGDWCIFTVADCTGHGVPGAFMSMLGISNLNEIVRRKEITKTGEVLDQLRHAVIEALKQKGVVGEQKDGMDIVFCAFNTKTRMLQYSGANNSLYLVRNTDNGPDLTEFKADPQPVAIHVNMTPFTTQEISVEPGDMLYLISDGFPDQFGGPKNKKFMIKRLREIFREISVNPPEEQKNILSDEFGQWKSGVEQVDDVTIMGVRL